MDDISPEYDVVVLGTGRNTPHGGAAVANRTAQD